MSTAAIAHQAALRRPASTPYARRLARERHLVLADIRGSGPGGRVTGTDVLRAQAEAANPPPASVPVAEFIPDAAPVPVFAASAQIAPHSAISVQIRTSAASDMLEQLRPFSQTISFADIWIKAAAIAFEIATSRPRQAIHLVSGKDSFLIQHASISPLSAIAKQREERSPAVSQAQLEISFLSRQGIRPVSKALGEHGAARLVIGVADLDHMAECLLCYDGSRLDDEVAEGFLAEFREHVEMPLRLMA